MIGEILEAVRQECLEFLKQNADPAGGVGTVIVETDFRQADLQSYSMPLILLDMVDGHETSQYPGGVTRVDWMFGFNSYHYMPDSTVDDDSGYSPELLDIIDKIRQHFSTGLALGIWLTQGMTGIYENYDFQFTLLGVARAKALNADGLKMGWRLGFDSMAIDSSTSSVVPSTAALTYVQQLDNSKTVIMSVPNSNLAPIKYEAVQQNMQIVVPENTYLESVLASAIGGEPVFKIGTTAGGADIVGATAPGEFTKITIEKYFEVDTTLYLSFVQAGVMNISLIAALWVY